MEPLLVTTLFLGVLAMAEGIRARVWKHRALDARGETTLLAASSTTDLTADLARTMTSMCPEDAERVRRALGVHVDVLTASRSLPDDMMRVAPAQ